MEMISVIVPTYNRASMLVKALKSVLTQTLSAAEIIVVDDGSSDDTEQVIHRISKSTSVPFIYLKIANSGPAAARNRGIVNSNHQLVAFLDSDDQWHRKKLEIQSEALLFSTEKHLISHTKETWYRRGLHLNQKKKHIPRGGRIFEQCLTLCTVGMSTVMVRKKIFEKYGLFEESLRCCEDYEFWLRISKQEKFLLIDRPLTIKNGGREDQVSQQFRVGMDRFRIQALAHLISTEELTPQQSRAARRILVEKCLIYGQGCQKYGNYVESEHYFKLARYLGERQISHECNGKS